MLKLLLPGHFIVSLLAFLINTSLSGQQAAIDSLAGKWAGYDGKGQKVILEFDEHSSLRTTTMDKATDFSYTIKTTAGQVSLSVTLINDKRVKATWPVVYRSGNQMQVTFPAERNPFTILFTKQEREKIKMSRLSASFGDTAMQYTTVISFGGDSVKAVTIVPNPRPVISDSTASSGDQLELSTGWGGGHSGWLAPSSGTFFIDNFSIGENKTGSSRFPVMLYYYMEGDGNVVEIRGEDIVYPANADRALAWLKRLKQKMPPEPLFFRN